MNQLTGIELISAERERQIAVEGKTPEDDDKHIGAELAFAADTYIEAAKFLQDPDYAGKDTTRFVDQFWPWDKSLLDIGQDPAHCLVQAARKLV
jgi:hypothetical protein